MDRWIVILRDRQDELSRSVRRENFQEHFKFLESNFDRIVFSCGLRADTGEQAAFVGGCWIVEAESKREVDDIVRTDPYFRLGLRDVIEVYRAFEGYV